MTLQPEAAIDYRVDARTLKRDAPILLLLALDLAFGFMIWSRLPARVPIHWNIHGRPDNFGPSWVNALAVPIGAVVIYALLLLLPLIDPRRKNYALFEDTARFYRGAIVLFMVGLHVVLALVSLGHKVDVGLVMRIAMPLLFIALGNRFGRLRHNYFFGFRLPWTLASEEVWNRTHRMAGRLWVAGGLVMLLAALLPPVPGVAVLVGVMVILTIVPMVYSWRLYRATTAPTKKSG